MGCELDHWESRATTEEAHHVKPKPRPKSRKNEESHVNEYIEQGQFPAEDLADLEEDCEEGSLGEEEDEEDKFNYLRLDTIEEEEGDESECESELRCFGVNTSTSRPQAEPRTPKRPSPGNGLTCRKSADDELELDLELEVKGCSVAEEAGVRQGELIRDGREEEYRKKQVNGRCDNNNHQNMSQQNKNSLPRNQHPPQAPNSLPSTNRLISEHQARQQQALFRALAERQKMLDELSGVGGQRLDLMSAVVTSQANVATGVHASSLNGSQMKRHKRRRRRRRRDSKSTDTTAVPLSSVDLSQMSDGMLDELLGHIASASSSSLSSAGESVDSFDESAGYTSASDNSQEDHDDHHSESSGLSESGARLERQRRLHLEDAPNVVGIHEDERAGQAGRRQSNCRDTHMRAREANRRDRDDDESDPRSEHELAIDEGDLSVGGCGGDSSVAVAAGAGVGPVSSPNEDQDTTHSRDTPMTPFQAAANSQLEQYFTSGLVKPHQFQGDSNDDDELECSGKGDGEDGLVEEVLARMLEALNDIGPNEQERLNELLESGFAHLEQLLNCNLAPTSFISPIGGHNTKVAGGSQLAQKLLSSQHQAGGSQTLLSKDSDYGSDTQSADCLSHEPTLSTSGDSPQQLIMACNLRQQQQQQQQQRGLQLAGSQQLSPLAVELSFKLAESLQRLAQQQAASRRLTQPVGGVGGFNEQPPTATLRRAPMKSVVLLNATPSSSTSRPSSSLSGNSGSEPSMATTAGRNWTPPVGELQSVASAGGAGGLQQVAVVKTTASSDRPNFTTRVNLVPGEVSSVIVARGATEPPPAASLRRHTTVPNGPRREDAQEDYHSVQDPTEEAPLTSQRPPGSASSDLKQPKEESQHFRSAASETPSPIANEQQQQQQVALNRSSSKRRSPRSSMRRKPATGSFGKAGHLRPGSPLPRLQLEEQVAAGGQVSGADGQSSAAGQRQLQLQLQRALILAQKYNYSPAKLAASKLSHKLQLKNLQQNQAPAQQTECTAINVGPCSPNRITSHKEPMEDRWSSGRIQLDVSYFAKSGSLTVHVIQCAELAAANKRRNTSNPYIKLYLLPDRSKNAKRKSSLHRNELEPRFDERFTFGPLKLAEFEERTLWLSVCHKDRLGRNEVLGELLLPLLQVRHQLFTSDLCQSTGAKWYELVARSSRQPQQQQPTTTGVSLCEPPSNNTKQQPLLKQPEPQQHAANLSASVDVRDSPAALKQTQVDELKATPAATLYLKQNTSAPAPANQAPITGQLFVALKFVLEQYGSVGGGGKSRGMGSNLNGELHVMIKEAHNISGFVAALASSDHQQQVAPPSGSLPNPFCKCYLLNSNGHRLSKHKTPHLKRTVNPRWDHKCVFGSLSLANLTNQAVEIQMYNRDSVLVSREYLGGIRLCSSGNQTGQQQSSSPAASENQNQTQTQTASDSVSIASSSQSGGDVSSLRRSLGNMNRDSSSAKSIDGESSSALCSERESRLWNQMLSKPNIWVYGELTLRYLHPIIPT